LEEGREDVQPTVGYLSVLGQSFVGKRLTFRESKYGEDAFLGLAFFVTEYRREVIGETVCISRFGCYQQHCAVQVAAQTRDEVAARRVRHGNAKRPRTISGTGQCGQRPLVGGRFLNDVQNPG
jgi:hypothetical protein